MLIEWCNVYIFRRMFFSFTFFMFFYNIFIGFLSCLLRIIKSIVFGAIFLPRLDNSALPRRVQMFDPGKHMKLHMYMNDVFQRIVTTYIEPPSKPTIRSEYTKNSHNLFTIMPLICCNGRPCYKDFWIIGVYVVVTAHAHVYGIKNKLIFI